MTGIKTVQIFGGSHDGAEYVISPGQPDLRLLQITAPVLSQATDQFGDMPLADVPYTVEVYGPATEADEILGRWSLLRKERP